MKRVENLPNEIAGRRIFGTVFLNVNIFTCKLICWYGFLWLLSLAEFSFWLFCILPAFFERKRN